MNRPLAETILENWEHCAKQPGFHNRNFRGDLVKRLIEAASLFRDEQIVLVPSPPKKSNDKPR